MRNLKNKRVSKISWMHCGHSTGGPAASIAGSCSADGFFDAAVEMAKPMLASRSSSIGSADEPLIATATNDRVIGRKDKICAEVLLEHVPPELTR
jgi:hypothetical protein